VHELDQARPGDPLWRSWPGGCGDGAGLQAALHLADHAAQVTMLVRGDSLDRAMSRYLVDRIEQHDRITVRTRPRWLAAMGVTAWSAWAIEGPEGEQTLPTDGLFVLIGAQPLTAGIEDWLRCDDRGYFMTGPDLLKSLDRSRWPLERDPLFLESSQPGCSLPATCATARSSASPPRWTRVLWPRL
jgi:thioredoxin reductase (NADPH)